MKFTNLFQAKYNEEQIKEIIRKIRIIHVHHRIGLLPHEDPGGRPYGTPASLDDVIVTADRIRLYPDTVGETTPDSHVKLIQSKISIADRILFLGFSFHRNNMKILGSLRKPEGFNGLDPFLATTTINLSSSEKTRIEKFGNFKNLSTKEMGIIDLLNNYEYL